MITYSPPDAEREKGEKTQNYYFHVIMRSRTIPGQISTELR